MQDYSNDQILTGILSHDSKVINYVYKEFFPMIERMVINNGGENAHAQDVFQEGMIVVYRKLKADGVRLCCKFSTYLYSICRKIWLQEIKTKEYRNIRKSEPLDMVCEPEPENDLEIRFHEIVHKHMNELSESCQKIIRLHLNNATIEEIRVIMGYKNAPLVMDRKYRCKKSLINRILNDPKFKALNDELIRENRTIY